MSRTTALRHTAWRWFWSTPARRGLTNGGTGGLVLLFFIPAMGLAIGGTAHSIRGWLMLAAPPLGIFVGGSVGAFLQLRINRTLPN